MPSAVPAFVRGALWAAVTAFAGALLFSFTYHPVGAALWTLLAALAVLALVRPFDAALVLAALGPLSTILAVVARVTVPGPRVFEAMVLAFLTGWSAGRLVRRQRLSGPDSIGWVAAALAMAAVTSGVVSAAVLLVQQSADILAGLAAGAVVADYAVHSDPVAAAMLFAEGVLLFVAMMDVAAGAPNRAAALLRMAVIAAVVSAAFNLLRIVELGMAQEHAWAAFRTRLATLRANVHHGDLNAAGSYFAMAIFMAAAFASFSRVAAAAGVGAIAIGLWISGSRTAMLAAVVAVAGAAAASIPGRKRRIAAVVVAALVTVAAALVFAQRYQSARHVATPSMAVDIRLGLARTAFAMTAAHPVFGIGLGHFFELSQAYASGPYYQGPRGHVVRENAHNNFLQVLAELGIPGLLLFLTVIAFAMQPLQRAAPLWGAILGLCAFLVTCLAGHPLLVHHTAYAFWMILGIAAATAAAPPAGRLVKAAGVALAIFFAAALPFRLTAAMKTADVEHTSTGFSRWQRETDGTRYRWAGAHATFFVSSSARAVRIPLRTGSDAAGVLRVRIFFDGREVNQAVIRPEEGWRTVRLLLPAQRDGRFTRVDLEAAPADPAAAAPDVFSDTGGVMRVGRPFVEE